MKLPSNDQRLFILNKLEKYQGIDQADKQTKQELINFIKNNQKCFERSLLKGHVNGSAWVVDTSFRYVLLTHHFKLDKWIQLGGHSDGDPNTFNVSKREAHEETGLTSIEAVNKDIFDIDIHPIPAHGNEPEHFHYDIRFIFTADINEPFVVSSESHDLKWIKLDNVKKFNSNRSVLRMVEKTPKLKK